MSHPSLAHLVTVVRGASTALSGPNGDIRRAGAQGLYVRDTRVLDRFEVRVDGERPATLGSSLGVGGRATFHAHVAAFADDNGDPTVLLRRDRAVDGGMRDRLVLTNHGEEPRQVRVEIQVGTDLAYVGEVKRGERGAPVAPARESEGGVVRLDAGGPASVEVRTEPAGRVEGEVLVVDLRLAPRGGQGVVEVTVTATDSQGTARAPGGVEPGELEAELGADLGPEAQPGLVADSADADLDRLVRRGLADLEDLELTDPDAPGDRFVAAGSPWYLTLFGRDAIWAAYMALPRGTELAMGTLRALARRQGRRVDPATEEAPGRILHELRTGDLAERADLPPVYYGSVDATPLFVLLAAEAWRWGADPDEVRALVPNVEAALGWIAAAAEADTDGFIRYEPGDGGLTNQGWKDSEDGIRHRDGRVAEPPIALAEVQGYAHDAAVAGAELLAWAGAGRSDRWRRWAADLRARFRDRFWVDDDRGRYPGLAIDGSGGVVDAPSSDIGHLLLGGAGAGIVDANEAKAIGRRLAAPEMDSGWGLRTMASDAVAYQPLSYHRGSVWPHDTAIVAWGLARAGIVEPASSLIRGLVAAGAGFDHRLPELFAGLTSRPSGEAPVPHPAACHPQAWSAGAALLLLRACLGLEPDLPSGRVVLRPLWPPPFPRLEVTGIVVGGGTVDVRIDDERGVDIDVDGLDVEVEVVGR